MARGPLAPAVQVATPRRKLRPVFWAKVAFRQDSIWGKLKPPVLKEDQLSALEELFAMQEAPTKAKAVGPAGSGVMPCLFLSSPRESEMTLALLDSLECLTQLV